MSFSGEQHDLVQSLELSEADGLMRELNNVLNQQAKIILIRNDYPKTEAFVGIFLAGSISSRMLLSKSERLIKKETKEDQGMVKINFIWQTGNGIGEESVIITVGKPEKKVSYVIDENGIRSTNYPNKQLEDEQIATMRSWLSPGIILWAPSLSRRLANTELFSLEQVIST